MQRRDYLRIAEAIRMGKKAVDILVTSGRAITPQLAVDLVAQHIADSMAASNPTFDRDLFLRNASVTVPTEH
jgi:hypothetical protein